MKILVLLFSILFAGNQNKTPASATLYPVGVGFNSICCGPPSDDFLRSFVKKFNKRNAVKLTADKIAGCGREGEYVILFHTQKLKPAIQKKLIAELQKIVPQQSELNKKTDTSSGTLEVLRNVKGSAYDHCRIKPAKWAY